MATQRILRDYQHASKIFRSANYRLAPKASWLFYVEFDLNPSITQMKGTSTTELGLVVKSASLPKFNVETKVQNAYNRPNIVQTKIRYEPVTIAFHDDQGDVVRDFWYDYYSFFYRDSDYSDTLYQQQTKYTARPAVDWGYQPRPVPSYTSGYVPEQYQYIQAVRIYSLYQGNFSEYELINPTIQSFRHGDHANGQNEFLQHEMTLQYEAVKYYTGYVTENTAGGFITLDYDLTPSVNLASGQLPAYETNNTNISDLASNNVHPGELANNPLNTLAGAASSFLGSALNGITASAGTALGGLISGSTSGTSGISVPSLSSLGSGISGAVSSAASSLGNAVSGISSSLSNALGIGSTSGGAQAQTVNTNLELATQQAVQTAESAVSQAESTLIPSLTAGAQSAAASAQSVLKEAASSLPSGLSGLSIPSIPGSISAAAGDAGISLPSVSSLTSGLPSVSSLTSSLSSLPSINGGGSFSA